MPIQHKQPSKVMGPRGAALIRDLYEAGFETFSFADAINLSEGSEKSIRNALDRLLRAGVIARVKPGLFNIVPFELGSQSEHMGGAPKLAIDIAKRMLPKESPVFLSHATAMAIHQMVTQPTLTVYVTVTKQLRVLNVMGTEIRFVSIKPEKFFGSTTQWIDKTTAIPVSDMERTILDSLKTPSYAGGLSEIAKAIWIKRDQMDMRKLIDYAKRLGVGAVCSRLGYLLQILKIGDERDFSVLSQNIASSYALLDPDMPSEGRYNSTWRLRLNVTEDELKAVTRT